MATEIGQLSVKLLMDSSALTTGAKEATGGLKKLELGAIATRAGLALATAAAAATAAAIFGIVKATSDAAAEQAQLAAVLKSTGQAAGFTQKSLNDMGEALRKNSIFDGGDITKAQTALLAFTGITGEQFPKALQAAADMAARTGMTIQQASETIGRALDVPSQGMSALSRQGFRFSDEQKKVVEQLEKTGEAAKAQNIILEALTDTYGGAAKAARDTFGGALAALMAQINDTMEGGDGSFDAAAKSVNELTNTLNDPNVKAGIASIVAGLAAITSGVVEFVANTASVVAQVPDFIKFLLGFGHDDSIGKRVLQIGELTAKIEEMEKEWAGFQKPSDVTIQLGQMRTELRRLQASEDAYQKTLRDEELAQKAAAAAAAAATEENKKLAAAKLAAEEAAKAAADRKKEDAARDEADKARLSEIASIIGGLGDRYDALAMSEADSTAKKLEWLAATDQQIQYAGAMTSALKEWSDFNTLKPLNSGEIIGNGVDEFKSDEERENERFAAQLERFKKHQEDMAIQGKISATTMEDLERVHQENLSNIRRQFTDSDISKTQSALSSISTLMNSHSRKMFEIGKAAAIANAIVSTALGVTKAMEIPFIGWAMAPLVAAAGIAQIQAIKSTTFGGGGSPAVSNTQAVNAASTPVADQRPTQRTNINLQGDFFSRDGVISLLNEAFKDGYTINGATA